ncbi:MAG: hypothetical protein AB8E82_13930 [Aureispira sp.]
MDISKLTGADMAAIAKLANIEAGHVQGLITMATAQKMPRAEVIFKGSVGKLDKKNKRFFTFVKEAKGSFFFIDMNFPMLKKDLLPRQKNIQKQLATAKEADKPAWQAYKTFIDALVDRVVTKKKMSATYGSMKFAKNESGKCFMYPVGKVQGADKANLHAVVNPLNLTSKTGHTICFLNPTEMANVPQDETTPETSTDNSGTDTGGTAPNNGAPSPRVQQLQNALKQLQNKLAQWQNEQVVNKKANMVKPLLNAVNTLLSHIANFINGQEGTPQDKAAVAKMQQTVQGYKAKLAQVDAKVTDQKGVATVNKMNEFFTQIKQDSQLLKDQHGDELAGLGDEDLVGILDQLLSA